MECPYCNTKLEHVDYFGRIASHQDGKIIGDIYYCPNGREQNEKCESEQFHVAGSFYMYRDNDSNLYEGYPC